MNEHGILTFPDGKRYEGTWENGKINGQVPAPFPVEKSITKENAIDENADGSSKNS